MAKFIKLTEDHREQIRKLFDDYIEKYKMTDGTVKFEKDFGSIDKKATIIFTSLAWGKMINLIMHFDSEVAWHCKATRDDDDCYVIYDCEVYPQIVTGVHVDTDKEKYTNWLVSHSDDEINAIRCQCHSHVNMSVSPSGTDLENNKTFINATPEDSFYIFMIWNKKLEREIRIYDFEKNLYFENKDIDYLIGEEASIDNFIDNAEKVVEVEKPQTSVGKTYIANTKGVKEYTTPYTQQPYSQRWYGYDGYFM